MVDCYLYFHLVCSVIGLIFERLISTRRQPRLPPISRVIRFYQFNCLFSPLLTNSFKLANNVMSLNGYTHSKYIIAFNRQVICLGVPRIALGIMNILPNLDRYWYFFCICMATKLVYRHPTNLAARHIAISNDFCCYQVIRFDLNKSILDSMLVAIAIKTISTDIVSSSVMQVFALT